MTDQIRAELLKIRSTRTTLGLVLGMVALVLLFVLLRGFLDDVQGLSSKSDQLSFLGVGSIAALFAALAGVLVVTSEYRFGTIRPTIIFNPRRSQVVGAKLVASMLAGIVFAVVGMGLSFGIGRAILSSRSIPSCPRRRRRRAAPARHPRGYCTLGRDRSRALGDPAQPDRLGGRTARMVAAGRAAALRARAEGRAVRAGFSKRCAHGHDRGSPPVCSRRCGRPRRLGGGARRGRHRAHRPAGRRLALSP